MKQKLAMNAFDISLLIILSVKIIHIANAMFL